MHRAFYISGGVIALLVAFLVGAGYADRVSDIEGDSSLTRAHKSEKIGEAFGASISVGHILFLVIAAILVAAGGVVQAIGKGNHTNQKAARRSLRRLDDNPFD